MARLIAELCGIQITIDSQSERMRPEKSEVNRLLGDKTLARSLLGWEPDVGLEDGLRQTIEWIRENLHEYRADVYTL